MAEINRIQMVFFDWAGAKLDDGSRSPSAALALRFSQAGCHLARAARNGAS